MTEAEALAILRQETAAEEAPGLDDAELETLLRRFRIADADGRAPTDAGWSPTWDLRRAVVRGWRLKAAKAAGAYDLSTDGQGLSRSQIVSNCLRMADTYARGALASPVLPGQHAVVEAE
jgi:hypothetical protein